MTDLSLEPAIVREAALGPRDDPLAALLESAYRALAPAPHSEADPAGLLIAGDGSSVGQQRIFERAAEVGRALPPRFIPHRLSNGAASLLAIRFQHTGRVVTLSCGRASLFRALAFAVTSLDAGLSPERWIVLSGDVDQTEPERVCGHAIALELRRDSSRKLASFSASENPTGLEVPAEGASLAQTLSLPRDWPGRIAFCDPERRNNSPLWIGAVKI